jgi:hypothetical protein
LGSRAAGVRPHGHIRRSSKLCGPISKRSALATHALEGWAEPGKAILGDVAKGGDPLSEKRKTALATSSSFRAVAEEYLERKGGMRRDSAGHRILDARGKPTFKPGKLRSADQRAAVLDRHVYPRLGSRQIDEIRRSDIKNLLDKIEDDCGASMADQVLAMIRVVMSWHASRCDGFTSPIVRRMSRTSTTERVWPEGNV